MKEEHARIISKVLFNSEIRKSKTGILKSDEITPSRFHIKRGSVWERSQTREKANLYLQTRNSRKIPATSTYVKNPHESPTTRDSYQCTSIFSRPRGKTADMGRMTSRDDNLMYNISVITNLK